MNMYDGMLYNDKKIMITGATGLIGSALVKKLYHEGASLFCPVRDIVKAESLFSASEFKSVKWVEMSIGEYLKELKEKIDYVIHCASPTSSKYFVSNPVETITFNFGTTAALLDYVFRKKVKGMIFLSSLESYGTVLDDSLPINETYQGYVDPLEVRSSYNMAKRICESLCHAYAKEYEVPVKIVRLTQTISPFITDNDMRVFAQFARKAANREDIVLHTDGYSARQYVYIDDAVNAILCVLSKGKLGEAYNVANESTYISVREMAEFVQKNFNPQHSVTISERSDMGYAPVTKIKLNTHKIQELGWKPQYDLYEMYNKLITELKRV